MDSEMKGVIDDLVKWFYKELDKQYDKIMDKVYDKFDRQYDKIMSKVDKYCGELHQRIKDLEDDVDYLQHGVDYVVREVKELKHQDQSRYQKRNRSTGKSRERSKSKDKGKNWSNEQQYGTYSTIEQTNKPCRFCHKYGHNVENCTLYDIALKSGFDFGLRNRPQEYEDHSLN